LVRIRRRFTEQHVFPITQDESTSIARFLGTILLTVNDRVKLHNIGLPRISPTPPATNTRESHRTISILLIDSGFYDRARPRRHFPQNTLPTAIRIVHLQCCPYVYFSPSADVADESLRVQSPPREEKARVPAEPTSVPCKCRERPNSDSCRTHASLCGPDI
jgi:hypothetical protein